MRIGELAKLSDVPASTIRYYESQGLLPKVKRTESGYRNYDNTALERLRLIRFSQKLGFNLEELPKLLNNDLGWDHGLVMQKLLEKQRDLRSMIESLLQKETQLNLLINELDQIWSSGKCMDTGRLDKILSESDF